MAIIVAFASVARADPPPARPACPISAYDVATRDDLLFAHLLAPFLEGDVADWPIVGGLAGQLGDWVNQFVDARQIAGLITEAFPIEGQPALRPLEAEVEACARTLGVAMPAVHVRNAPACQAYVARAFDRDHLVLTSGLLKLFEGRPEELRFVVGHELGHVKCGHAELKQKAYGLLSSIRAVELVVVPDRFREVLPTLALGRLYTWCRESEISADRAGLLCCGEPKVAYRAIMRLQHGLDAGTVWIDPEGPDFDPGKVIDSFRQWQNRPFVGMILDLKRHSLEHPFIPERLAALKAWADADAYREIMGRTGDAAPDRLIEVVEIRAFELAPEGRTVDPYAIVFDGKHRVLRTATAPAGRAARWRGFRSTDRGVDQPRSSRDGRPLFVEIWDDNTLSDTLVGGFVIYPNARDAATNEAGERVAEYTTQILWDWKEPGSIARPGFARATVRFLERPAPAPDAATRKAGS